MKSRRIHINAYGPANLFDLSSDISTFVKDSEIVNGLVFVFSIGSTGALVNVQDEALFSDWVMTYIPFSEIHAHPGNAFAHLRSTLFGSNISLTIEDSKIINGSILKLLENTAGRKKRPIELKVFGEFRGGGKINMKVASNTLPVKSNGWIDIIDLNEIAFDVIRNSGISDGFLHIESMSRKTAISTTEFEAALLSDTADFIAETVKTVKEDKKGDIAAALLGSSMNFPIKDGRLEVGTWQQPVFLDFAEPGSKEIFLQAVGL